LVDTIALKNYVKYYFLLGMSILQFFTSRPQSGYGQAVFKQDFGFGNSNPATIGAALGTGKTAFTFSDSVCPAPGRYTIIRRIPVQSCFNNEWIGLSRDNDPTKEYGMMMVVNNNFYPGNRLVYTDTVNKTLCPGALYRFSVATINLDLIDGRLLCPGGPDYPLFELRLESETGLLIKKDTTPPLVSYAAPPLMGYKFTEQGFDFTVPPGTNKVVVKITLLGLSYSCAEDFAIDDIQIRPRGPAVAIGFNNEPSTTVVKSVCFQDNRTVALSGTMGSYYPNPTLQWQQSTDNGITWSDIPGATNSIYSRSFSSPDTFLFRLSGGDASTISNPNCRVVSDTRKVEVDGLPTNYSVTNNSPICSGQDLKFKGEGAASYLWTGPNGFYDNISNPHIFFSSVKDSGMYYVEVFSLGGCRVKDSTYVTVIGTDVTAGADTLICKGQSVRLRASNGSGYLWSPATGLSNTRVINPSAQPEITTVYTVKVTDKDGCSDTARVEVKVKNRNAVTAVIGAADYLCRAFDSASFTSKSAGDINKWYWNFGNGQTSDQSVPAVQRYQIAANTRLFQVMLAVSDTAGCTDTAYHTLKVADNCYIAVPTAFTPNRDGLNDELYPLNAYKASHLLFRVYNRNGRLVFQSKDWTRKWDGRVGCIEQAAGPYMWTLDYNDAAGKNRSLKGTTILIR
jgi:gliding motility-associated-like protein